MLKSHIFVFAGAMAALVLTTLCITQPAYAQKVALGGSASYAATTTRDVPNGGNSGGYLGLKFDALIVAVQPELMATYTSFGASDGWRTVAGARAWLGIVVLPGVYAHLGYGEVGGAKGATYDAGILLDLSFDLIQFGVHSGYAGLENIHWFDLGAHAQLNF